MARHARPSPGAHDHRRLRRGGVRRGGAVLLAALVATGLGVVVGMLADDGAPTAAVLPATTTIDAPTPRPSSDVSTVVEVPTVEAPASTSSHPASTPVLPTARPGPPTEPAVPAARVVDEGGWVAVLGRLDAARSSAFALGDRTLLAAVYADGSGPLARDEAALDQLSSAGVRAAGLRIVIDKVEVISDVSDQVVLRVVDSLPAYRLVRPDGSLVETRSGRGQATWFVTLSRRGGDWLIASIETAAGETDPA